jgi:anti-sigma B factor antagonist
MLKVYTRRLGDATVLFLRGRIVTGETSALRETVFSQSGVGQVVLDLARVNGIDAGGLGVLLELRAQTLSRHMGFRLTNVTQLVRQVLELTRLDSVFEISSTDNVSAFRASAILQSAPCTSS